MKKKHVEFVTLLFAAHVCILVGWRLMHLP